MPNVAVPHETSLHVSTFDSTANLLSADQQTESIALALLESHPHFKGQRHSLRCRCLDGCLYMTGKLPSFYLKQLAQEALRTLEGASRIENNIVVASPVGEVRCLEDAPTNSKSSTSSIRKTR